MKTSKQKNWELRHKRREAKLKDARETFWKLIARPQGIHIRF